VKFTETGLAGCYIIELAPFFDQRGGFVRNFCKNEFRRINHTAEFVQFNQSYNHKKGTLRGMHYQKPPFGEIKLIKCISGRVHDVVVDIRKDSPTFREHVSIELSADNDRMIYIPAGMAHGFLTLEDNSQLIYHHTEYYRPDADAALNYADPAFNISWPIPVAVISEKDAQHPFIDDKFSGITI
jgi:dTDP-4-dehydrorhamnose 3,5-epimerase